MKPRQVKVSASAKTEQTPSSELLKVRDDAEGMHAEAEAEAVVTEGMHLEAEAVVTEGMHVAAEALVTECLRNLRAGQAYDDVNEGHYCFLQTDDAIPMFPTEAFPEHLLEDYAGETFTGPES